MKNWKIIFCSLLVGISFASFSQTQTSDFTANADGWTIFNTSTGASAAAGYSSTGGNPGGFINDNGTSVGPTILYAEAPAKFRGNFSFSYNQNLTFDLKTSFAGTDNANGDIILQNSAAGITLFYQLPVKPGTASFTSYTVTINETFSGWHFNSVTGAVPTQVQMKAALSNITMFRIRTKYTTVNTGPAIGSVDNVILHVATLANPPIITSFTPASALPGINITITGLNFNTTTSQNVVYFKNVKATVVNATATQLVVTAPASAPYGPITALNLGTGLQGTSVQSFSLRFDNNKDFGGRIIPATMGRGTNTILQTGTEAGNGFGSMDQGDLNGDGWIDLIGTETSSNKIIFYGNQKSTAPVSVGSFSSFGTLPSMAAVPGGLTSLSEVIAADVDSDGKLDVVASISSNLSTGTSFIAVFRNTSASGSFSFAAPVFFALPYYSALTIASCDIDGDGRIDILSTSGTSPSNLWINQNLSTPGNIDFAYGITAGPGTSGYSDIAIGDMNGDGKPEIIAAGQNSATLSIYQNTSTPGSISMLTPFTVPALTNNFEAAVADLDADNKLDLIWGGATSFVYFSRNIFSGTFNASSFGPTIQVVSNKVGTHTGFNISDINADGNPDIVVSGQTDLGIMENSGIGGNLSTTSYNSPVLYQGSATGTSLFAVAPTVADFNGDNKPEVSFIYTNVGAAVSERGILIFNNESYPAPVLATATLSGAVGTTLSINGSLMYTGNVFPSFRLSTILSPISGGMTNTLGNITIPAGAMSSNLIITNHGLLAIGPAFKITFPTTQIINATSFGPSIDFGLSNNTRDGLAMADFDDDGKSDAYIVDNFGTGKVFRNTATPGAPITAASLTVAPTTFSGNINVVALDIDGDGKIDVNNGASLLKNSSPAPGTISFLSGPGGVPTNASSFLDVAVADFNKDGKLDLAMTKGPANFSVYENRSSKGTFLNVSNLQTFENLGVSYTKNGTNGDVVAEDFDGDGYTDIIVTNESTNNMTFYLNAKVNGPVTAASFTSLGNFSSGSGNQPNGLTAKDFDGDGKIDLAITWFNLNFISVYRNISTTGNINFQSPDTFTCLGKGYDIDSQDLDGDGKPEIVVIHQPNPGPGSFSIFQNQSTPGNFNFGGAINYALTRWPQGISFSDVNADGKPDILIIGNQGAAAPAAALMVFENKLVGPSLTITQQPSDANACLGSIATFNTAATGTTNIGYQWQFSSTSTGTFIDITSSGGYSNANSTVLSVNTTGNFGAGFYRCKVSGDFVISQFTSVRQLTIITVTPPGVTPATGCLNVPVTLTATGGSSGQYRWYAGSTDPNPIPGEVNSSYTIPGLPLGATTYFAALNNGTCESSRIPLVISISTCGSQPVALDIVVFNALSPNGDGKNDFFLIQNIELLPSTQNNTVIIFNRWGDEVFTATNYNNTDRVFRGVSNGGTDLPSGNYFYKIKFVGDRKEENGFLTLRR